jgi:hypothetical protein
MQFPLYYITRAFGFTESHDYHSAMGSHDRIRFEGSFAFVHDNCDLSVGVSEQGTNKKNELIVPVVS